MDGEVIYDVRPFSSGWLLRRRGGAGRVAFPTRDQAVLAGTAICRDEAPARLVIRGPGAAREERVFQDPMAATG